jgi:molecular chaperone DnaK
MDEAEVDKLVKEAEAKKDEDKKKKWVVEARNLADSTVHQAEKTIADNADKVKDDEKKEAEEKIKELKDVLAKTDASKEDIENATKPLSDIMMKIGQAIYSQWWAEWASATSEEKKDDDGVVDAEVEGDDKDDGKNTTRV